MSSNLKVRNSALSVWVAFVPRMWPMSYQWIVFSVKILCRRGTYTGLWVKCAVKTVRAFVVLRNRRLLKNARNAKYTLVRDYWSTQISAGVKSALERSCLHMIRRLRMQNSLTSMIVRYAKFKQFGLTKDSLASVRNVDWQVPTQTNLHANAVTKTTYTYAKRTLHRSLSAVIVFDFSQN